MNLLTFGSDWLGGSLLCASRHATLGTLIGSIVGLLVKIDILVGVVGDWCGWCCEVALGGPGGVLLTDVIRFGMFRFWDVVRGVDVTCQQKKKKYSFISFTTHKEK